eukprot:EG_transcript_8890
MTPVPWHLAVVGLLLAPDPIHAAPVPHALGSPKLRTAVVSAGSTRSITSAPLRRLQLTPCRPLPRGEIPPANSSFRSAPTPWAAWGLPCLLAGVALGLLGAGRPWTSRRWLALSAGPAEVDTGGAHLPVDIPNTASPRRSKRPQLTDETQALLEGHRLDVSALLKAYPSLVASPTELIARRIDNLTRLGLDARAAVQAEPKILGAGEAMVTETFVHLQARGFNVAKLLKRSPAPLCFTCNKLERTFRALEAHGLDPIVVATKCPSVVGLAEANIMARVEYLRDVGFDYKRLLTAVPAIFAISVPVLEQKISFLNGLNIDPIRAVCRMPGILTLQAATLERKVQLLRSLGLNPKLVVGRFPPVLMKSEHSIEERMEYLRRLGLDAHKVVHTYPPVLGLGLGNLKSKVSFLLEEMRLPIEVLNATPAYFGYNLETRIIPRYRFLVYTGRELPLLSRILTVSEARFACEVARRSLAEYLEWKQQHCGPPRTNPPETHHEPLDS